MLESVEEILLNEEYQKKWGNLRRYRLEYGFECGCPEGLIYLPASVDIDEIVEYLNSKITFKCRCYENN